MDLLRIALMIVPMAIGLTTALGVLAWTRRRRLSGRRSPLTQGLLRSPGHNLRIQFDDIYFDAMAWVTVMIFFPMLLGALQSSAPLNMDTAVIYSIGAV
ncbi:MAG: hypothetical protein Q7U84_00400, partial [Polynucleobacter sp.]|nr:hypothetical protein [Polynucleobacter sp.]